VVERSLFAKLQADDEINPLKQTFQKRFGITARQFNAAYAGRRRSGSARSSPSPAFGQGMACDQSAWAAEIPVCKSSVELFEFRTTLWNIYPYFKTRLISVSKSH
jgi:hypothetical protein